MLEILNQLLKDQDIVLKTDVVEENNKVTLKADVLIDKGKYIEHFFTFDKEEIPIDEAISLFVSSIDNFKQNGYYKEDDFEHLKKVAKLL